MGEIDIRWTEPGRYWLQDGKGAEFDCGWCADTDELRAAVAEAVRECGADASWDGWRASRAAIPATCDEVVAAIYLAGWCVVENSPRVYIANAVPDCPDGEPGSDWDEECDDILATIREAVEPLGWVADWSDDDIVVEPDKSVC